MLLIAAARRAAVIPAAGAGRGVGRIFVGSGAGSGLVRGVGRVVVGLGVGRGAGRGVRRGLGAQGTFGSGHCAEADAVSNKAKAQAIAAARNTFNRNVFV